MSEYPELSIQQKVALGRAIQRLQSYRGSKVTPANLHEMEIVANQEILKYENYLREVEGSYELAVDVSKLTCTVVHDIETYGSGHVSLRPIVTPRNSSPWHNCSMRPVLTI